MPFDYWMPYGAPLPETVDNDAVSFVKQKKDVQYTFTKVSGVSMEDNVKKTDSEITVGDDMETVSVNKKTSYTGYIANNYRNVLKNISPDRVKQFLKDAAFLKIETELKSYTIENKEYKYNYHNENPLTFNTNVQIKESWVENAGRNYLVSIGKTIGEQSNLYQETERKYAIDLYYPKKYIHTIKFIIRDGYTVKNADNLIINQELKNANGEVIGKFLSSATIIGNTVTVSVEEFYDFTHLEKEKYGDYRALINSAYDFYKSSILLSKV